MTGSDQGQLLVCYDGSEDAKRAIARAGELLSSKRALVLTVWQPAAGLGSFAWTGVIGGVADFAELDRSAREVNNQIAQEGVGVAQEAGLQAEPLTEESAGPVWQTIVQVAEDHDAAVIVMGSRGLTGLRSGLMGSVSTAVVHHTHRPTLIVR
ncbi:MAG: universal stress protein [Solirubrobacteraceae bacterium]